MAATSLTLRGLLIGALGAALVALSAGASSAQVALWTGASSSDWTNGSNWSTGTAPVAGQTVNIGGAGATRPDTVLGIGGPSVVSIGAINVGQVAGVPGALTIQNGSRLTSTSIARLAVVAGSSGTVTVTGSGSQWTIPLGTFYVGFQGTGTLSIENGGQVTTGSNTILGAAVPRRRARSTSAAAAPCRRYPFGAAPARARPISTMVFCARRPLTRPS
ncbi:hypothetical protein [Rhizobium ruizarguesonis]|nr:hypothetical protein [Rhizobium ruizarguesonis]UED33750.1 hypothetical protein BSO17_05825 [Rhizobium ruizarguesonis]